MVIGAVWCKKDNKTNISNRIKEIKSQFGLSSTFEIKWP